MPQSSFAARYGLRIFRPSSSQRRSGYSLEEGRPLGSRYCPRALQGRHARPVTSSSTPRNRSRVVALWCKARVRITEVGRQNELASMRHFLPVLAIRKSKRLMRVRPFQAQIRRTAHHAHRSCHVVMESKHMTSATQWSHVRTGKAVSTFRGTCSRLRGAQRTT